MMPSASWPRRFHFFCSPHVGPDRDSFVPSCCPELSCWGSWPSPVLAKGANRSPSVPAASSLHLSLRQLWSLVNVFFFSPLASFLCQNLLSGPLGFLDAESPADRGDSRPLPLTHLPGSALRATLQPGGPAPALWVRSVQSKGSGVRQAGWWFSYQVQLERGQGLCSESVGIYYGSNSWGLLFPKVVSEKYLEILILFHLCDGGSSFYLMFWMPCLCLLKEWLPFNRETWFDFSITYYFFMLSFLD